MTPTSPIAIAALAVLASLPCVSPAGPADEALAHAVRSGDTTMARTLLAGRADPNYRLPDGSTPLAWAVEHQDGGLVRLLLDRGAKASAGVPSMAPLIIACQYGDPAILDMLLSAGADLNAARPDGITPLALCAGHAPAPVVERMIAAGAEVDRADSRGQTPLMWAAAKGRIENIGVLVDHGAQINRATDKGFTPLFFALKSGDPRVPVTVLEAGGNPDHIAPDGTSVVQLAMYQKDYAFAARMIGRGTNLKSFDRNGNQLLHAAVLADQPPLVKLLLEKGADPDALTGPSRVKYRFEVNFKSGDYEVPPRPPLLLAAESGHADVMRMLVEAGADTKYRMEDGTNVVHAAAMSGRLAALELALQLIPDPNTTTADGQTALHLILASGGTADSESMMRLLASKGARIDIRNRSGQTPADIAKEAQTVAKTAYEATFGNQTVSRL